MSKVNTNLCVITGNLCRDAELKYTKEQTPVLAFTVAVNRLSTNGEQQTDFFPCVSWSKYAEQLTQYMKKGKLVLVRGQMRSRSYEAKDGHKVTVWELIADKIGGIELLGGIERPQNSPAQNYRQPQTRRNEWNPLDVDEQPRQQETANIPF